MASRNRLWAGVSLCLAAIAIATPLFAQFTTSGAVFGKVTGPDGRPLPGVTVRLKSPQLAVPLTWTSDSNGAYRFGDILPGTYALSADLSGFVTTETEQVVVRVGSTLRLDIQMAQAKGVNEQVSITAVAPQIESIKSQVNKYISFQEVQNLPLQNRQFLDVLLTVPGVTGGVPAGTYADRGPRNSVSIHGARTNDNDFLLDGAENNDKSDLNYEDIASVNIQGGPTSSTGAGRAGQTFQVGTALQSYNLDAVQEVQVSTSLMSAEFGSGGSGGVINVITRSGSNLLAGSVTAQEQRDAWVKGSTQSIKRDIAAVSLGGAIVKDKTFFFGTLEGDDHKLGFDFTLPSYEVPDYLRNPNSNLTANDTKRESGTFKVTQQFNASHTLTFTANYINEQADVLNTLFRERQLSDAVHETYGNKSFSGVIRDVALLGATQNMTLESILNSTTADRTFNSSTTDPRMIFNYYIPDYHSYTTGMNSPNNSNTITTLGWSEKLTLASASSFSKFGVGVDYFKQHSQQAPYLSLYLFPDSDPASNPTEYLSEVATNLTASVTNVFAFAQTDWFINPKTTLNLGLRYAHDNLIKENTVEPRIGLAYDPSGNGRQVFRAGFGLYHDRSNLVGVTGALRPPEEFGNVIGGIDVSSGPPSAVVLDPNIKLPTIYKFVLGYQQQLGQKTTTGVTLFANLSRDLFYQQTLNRADANGNRPDPTKGDLVYYGNYGKSDVYDLEFEFRHLFGNGSMVQASYTYEHAYGNSTFDFISGNDPIQYAVYQAGQIQPQQVWGPLSDSLEHNVKLSGVFLLPWGFQFSPIINWNSGGRYFWYTSWYELPSYYEHFAFYGGGYNEQKIGSYFDADVRVAKSFKIGGTTLLAYFDMFNVTDRMNPLERNGLYAYNYGAPIGDPGTTYYRRFATPTFYGPRRSAQLGVRFSF
jgi:outer membrane receptor for ferrienterochelin and colicin